jgi:hypothetical protein
MDGHARQDAAAWRATAAFSRAGRSSARCGRQTIVFSLTLTKGMAFRLQLAPKLPYTLATFLVDSSEAPVYNLY